MAFWGVKLIAIIAIAAVGLAGGWFALWAERKGGAETFFSLGSAFAAGVFMGAGLIHLLGDAVQGFNKAWPGLDYPLAFLLAGASCVLILWLEKVLLAAGPPSEHGAPPAAAGRVASYTVLIVLSTHSILAGIALGAEGTVLGSLAIFAAIIAHKGSAAFALAVDLRRGGIERGPIGKWVLIFSLMTPLGVVLGLLFKAASSGTGGRGLEAVFDALAAGTFIYIAALDIMAEEFSTRRRLGAKFGLVCAGLGLMALIAVWM